MVIALCLLLISLKKGYVMLKNTIFAGASIALLLTSAIAQADVVLGSVYVEASEAEVNPATNLINQSGLSQNYVSGVTDFDYYANTIVNFNPNNLGVVGGMTGLGSFFFDLGDMFNVNSIAVWGQENGTATMTSYDLYASDTFGVSGTRTYLGSFIADFGPDATIGNFSATSTQFIELDVTGNLGHYTTRVNEIVFGGSDLNSAGISSDVSTPLLGLSALTLLGLSSLRRKMKQ